jgi:hypothetical protein
LADRIDIKQTKNISLKCRGEMLYRYGMFLDAVPELKTEIYAGVFKGKELIKEIKTGVPSQKIIPGGDFGLPLNFENIPTGKYFLRFGIKSKNYPVTHNSENIQLVIR